MTETRAPVVTREVLVPTVFAEEQARRKVPAPSSTAEVADADTLVIAATNAWPEYQKTGAYICQPPLRSFRAIVQYLGFYAKRRIEAAFPGIVAFRPNILWSRDTVTELRGTGDLQDAQLADIVEGDLGSTESVRTEGVLYQVVMLDPEAGFVIDHAIKHEGQAAWVRGQRYTSSRALKTQPTTTEELRAAGG